MNNDRAPLFLDSTSTCKTFLSKPEELKKLINEALHIINSFGLPFNGLTDRSLERMAMAFLAVTDVKTSSDWKNAKDMNDNRSMKSRDIINYWNEFFNENVSSGSYDDIRRKDLDLLVLAEIIIRSKPDSSRNNPSRGYVLNPECAKLVKGYGSKQWDIDVKNFISNIKTLSERMAQKRNLKKVEITIPTGAVLDFSLGEHNELQKSIIEEFLPLFGHGAEILYVGDTAKKHIINEEEKLKALGFFELEHGELPDIIAYSKSKNWLFVIEAVYSCNPVTIARKIKIEELAKSCTAEIIYVSAFPNKQTFISFASTIAWETEVWIANEPEHMIHLNGDKFLGPYKKN